MSKSHPGRFNNKYVRRALSAILLWLASQCTSFAAPAQDWQKEYDLGFAEWRALHCYTAVEHLKKALAIAETFDSKDPRLEKTLCALATNQLACLNKEEGLATYQKAIDLQLSLGKTAALIQSYKDIVHSLSQGGHKKQALEYAEAEWKILSKTNNKLEISYAQEQLSQLHAQLDDTGKAIEWGQKSLESMAAAKGVNSPEFAQSLSNFGYVLRTLKELDDADKFTTQSVAIFRKLALTEQLILSLTDLGLIKHDKGYYKAGISCFLEAMQLNEKTTKIAERKEMRNIECWKHLAESSEKAQEWQAAEIYWKKLIDWKLKNGKDPDYYRTMLAFCYGHEGKFKEADETFSEILQQKRNENDNAKLGTYLDWYVRYLESTGRSSQADQARKELNALRR